jgi:ABC-type branched-subunit amino acid transport system substrate-binding protein
VDPSAKRIAIVYESDTFATTAALSVASALQAKGFHTVYTESYQTGTTDFSSFVQKIANAKPDAILGGGHSQDGILLAQEMARQGVTAKLVVLLVSPSEPIFGDIGIPALGIIGPSQWEPEMAYSAANAYDSGIPFYGPSAPDFTLAYRQAYGKDPTYFAAGGYAAGLVLQRAIEQAGTLNQDAIRLTLDKTRIMTFFGFLQFDVSAKNHGLQNGHEMVYVQWQADASGHLVKRIVWPVNLAIAPLLYPKP